MHEQNIYLYGRVEEIPEQKILHAGELEMIYENGFLRYIKAGKDEVLRMIYFAVRDQNWGTILGQIKDEKLNVSTDHFEITYRSDHRKDNIDILFNCRIQGTSDSKIYFRIEGEALSSFKKNRIGFCVLHPIDECIGERCIIEHWNGSRKEYNFPELISPHQPFKDIKSMAWTVNNQYDAKVSFEGDIFESEDQRNWTDASYKTYCTPLEISFPAEVFEGDKINQGVEVEISSTTGVDINNIRKDEKLMLSLDESESWNLPELGTQVSGLYPSPDKGSIDQLKQLELKHFRFDIDLNSPEIDDPIDNIVQHERKFDLSTDLALFFGDDPAREYHRFVQAAKQKIKRPNRIYLFDKGAKTTSHNTIKLLINTIREDFPDTRIGAGTNAYFTELNRERVDPSMLDFLSYSINPQVHAFDEASLTETLTAQYYTVISARRFAEGRDIVVSPVTLKPRYNPNITGPEPEIPPDELPDQVDPRQMSLFGACWTLGSIKYLTEGKAAAITYYETAGWRGIVQGSKDPPLSDKFKSESGDVFPMYQVFAWLNELSHLPIIKLRSSQPLKVDGLAFIDNGRFNLLLANFTNVTQEVNIDRQEMSRFRIKSLNSKNVQSFMKDPGILQGKPDEKVNSIQLDRISLNWIIID